MKQTILVFLVSVLFLYSSCNNNTTYPSKFLDVEEHSEMWAKWKELNIKNYSFTYSCSYWIGYPSFVIVGNVTVKDGIGTVKLDLTRYYKGIKPHSYRFSYYKMTTMEEVFEHILDKHYENKDAINKSNVVKVWYDRQSYSNYFFPMNISYSSYPHGMENYRCNSYMVGINYPDNYRFEITDFKITE